MAKLYLSIKNQTLTISKDIDQIVENSNNYLYYEIKNITSDWEQVPIKEVIFTYKNESYKGNTDEVPEEVLHAPGFLISVVGKASLLSEGSVITTSPVFIPVHISGNLEGEIPGTGADNPALPCPEDSWQENIVSVAGEFSNWLENGNGQNIQYSIPFDYYNEEQKETKKSFSYKNNNYVEKGNIKATSLLPCPKYLGFKIKGNARLYLYIGDINRYGDFEIDSKYHICTDSESDDSVNYLKDIHSRFIEIEEEKYFYYSIEHKSDVTLEDVGEVTILGANDFPEGEVDIIATTPDYVLPLTDNPSRGKEEIMGINYYGIVLPSDCFYAILNKTSPKESRENSNSYETYPFYVSYEKDSTIFVEKGASFGYIPKNTGAAILSLPDSCNLNELYIYTDKEIKISSKDGRKNSLRKNGQKAIKDFFFDAKKRIQWSDGKNTRFFEPGRRFYGIPYSSRWANSHFIGFEVTPETALNALNDEYSIAYDLTDDRSEINADGGTGYGLVCSAFLCLISGNPYPQTNAGFTFDKSFILETTTDVNVGECLMNTGVSHCVFLEEFYRDGYSLYEAVDPCVAKTLRTCYSKDVSYAGEKVKRNFLNDYTYSIVGRRKNGAINTEELVKVSGKNTDILSLFKEFSPDKLEIPKAKVRPWRGHKSVYGPWDVNGKSIAGTGDEQTDPTFTGSGIGVTIHDSTLTKFYLTKIDGSSSGLNVTVEIPIPSGATYVDIKDYVLARGSGTYKLHTDEPDEVPELFRYLTHNNVSLKFDKNGKAYFTDQNGNTVKDIMYIYAKVKGLGGRFNTSTFRDEEKVVVIAAGSYYPDLAADPSRILELRAAVAKDTMHSDMSNAIDKNSWGLYSCNPQGEVTSAYNSKDTITKEELAEMLKNYNII